ncbi:MAG: acylneuraminate cytidylyltransferase family protein [Chthoniobacterales bacterium]|nr:acylneuraminate cytidylyltransferase family protein [Chthoniobacterales bacterium]
MNTLGVILARSGSVGLPNKHLLPLLGPPVIGYTFDHARHSKRLSRIAVSSDCPQILAMAKWAGFDAIKRPADLATSEASVQDVMLHAMHGVEQSDPTFRAGALVVLYGNVPVRGEGVIDRCIDMLESTGCDSVRTFCPVGKWHPSWMWKLGADGSAPAKHADNGSIHRRQDLEKLFLHDGAAVAVTRASMLRGEANPGDPHAFFGTNWRAVETAMDETVEVDHLRDLYWAEAVLRERQEKQRKPQARRMAS